ncbi:MAG: transposase [Thainema sp.]
MRYNPDKHHRRSIRLKGYDYSSPGAYFITICTYQRECLFGNIVDGKMQLNSFGQVIQGHGLKLSNHHSHLRLDEFIVMPNHIHGILILSNENECDQSDTVGAGLADTVSVSSDNLIPKPAPTNDQSRPGTVTIQRAGISNIIRGFKSFSARQINRQRQIKGSPVWQRNYYEHI